MFELLLNNKYKILLVLLVLLCGFFCYRYLLHGKEGFLSGKPTDVKLMLFFSHNCGHCNKLMNGDNAPWKDILNKYKNNLNIEEIDCDKNPDVIKQFNLDGFPTIKLFNSKNESDTYEGDNSLESIEKFITTSPVVQHPQ